MSIITIINYGIYAFGALLALFGLASGWRRGLVRQTLRSVTVAASALAAVWLTKRFYNVIANYCSGKTLWELLEKMKIPTIFHIDPTVADAIQSMDASAAEYIVPLLLSFLILPFLMILIFWAISLVMHIVYHALAAIANLSTRRLDDFNRLFGSLIGALQGVAVTLLLLIPLAGLLHFSEQTVETLKNNDPESETVQKISDTYDIYLKEFSENQLVVWTRKLGGDKVCRYYATVTVDGRSTNMQNEAQAVVRIVAKVASFGSQTDWDALNESEKAKITEILNDLTANPYLCSLSAGIVRGTAKIAEENLDRWKAVQEPLRTLFASLLQMLRTCTPEILTEDLNTIKDVYFLLSDTGVLFAMNNEGNITAALIAKDANGKTVITRAVEILQRNERTSAVLSTLTDISFAVMLAGTGMDEETLQAITEVKQEVMDTLNDLLAENEDDYETHEDYVAAISDSIENALQAHGITLEPNEIEGIAEYIADPDSFTDEDGNRITEIDEEHLIEFLLSYYDSIEQSDD